MDTPTGPASVGIILDGNRRWAKAKGLPQLEGHRQGSETFKKIVLHAQDRGVRHLAAYVFSTENWNRSGEEVSYLMNLIRHAAQNEFEALNKKNVRIRFVGERERFADDIQKLMYEVEAASATNTGLSAWLCLSYGGRAEIVAAAKAAASSGKEITEETLRSCMWTAEMPDPDLIIRTSGEKRLSGFLAWAGVYSELFFTETLWPDFSPQELDTIFAEFAIRERRHGK